MNQKTIRLVAIAVIVVLAVTVVVYPMIFNSNEEAPQVPAPELELNK